MLFEMDRAKFYKTIYDDELNHYINGNFIANIRKNNLDKEEQDVINMSLIIDYYLHKYNIQNNKNNIQKYMDSYNEIINNNYVIIDKEIAIPFYKTKEGIEHDKEIKENEEYETDRRLHYQKYFMRYKDIDYIIDHYRQIMDEYENKDYYFDDNNTNISDNESCTSDIDDYMLEEYYEDNYEDDEYYEEEFY
jgi:hypothetical protein|tara:strand:+ start:838 stop:1413 length:576 start_codon:yes stop_codon:yes gene_type:complete